MSPLISYLRFYRPLSIIKNKIQSNTKMQTTVQKMNMSPMLEAIIFNKTHDAVRYGGKSPCHTAKPRSCRSSKRSSSRKLLNFSTACSTRALTSAQGSTMALNDSCSAFSVPDLDEEETKDYEAKSSSKEVYKVIHFQKPERRGYLVHTDSISE